MKSHFLHSPSSTSLKRLFLSLQFTICSSFFCSSFAQWSSLSLSLSLVVVFFSFFSFSFSFTRFPFSLSARSILFTAWGTGFSFVLFCTVLFYFFLSFSFSLSLLFYSLSSLSSRSLYLLCLRILLWASSSLESNEIQYEGSIEMTREEKKRRKTRQIEKSYEYWWCWQKGSMSRGSNLSLLSLQAKRETELSKSHTRICCIVYQTQLNTERMRILMITISCLKF